ncbi:MAG: GlsB/YeaQ/YmgE family stress response membrane protein [Alphaproteobacteria bacterium]
MGIIVTIVTGLIVGIVAKLLMPGRDPGGIIVTILLGIAGSVVGRWLADIAGIHVGDGWGPFIAGVVGAVFLLAIYRLVVGRRA